MVKCAGSQKPQEQLRELALGIWEPHVAFPFLLRLLPGLSVAHSAEGTGLSVQGLVFSTVPAALGCYSSC